MIAQDVADALGDARPEGRDWRCRCPLHGGRSLTLRDGDGGRLLAWCFAGCDSRDVLRELRRRGLLDRDTTECGHSVVIPPHHDGRRIACARRIWDGAHDTLRSPVVRYLASRDITLPPPPSLRWTPRCWHREERAHLPAMIALVEHVERGIVGVHRTYLTSDYRRRDRASLGPIGGGAVRLAAPGGVLMVGEGIETCLAAMQATGHPAWAALSTSGLRALDLPADVRDIIVLADGDEPGARAARDCAWRWKRQGRRVRIARPAQGMDFNDMLMGRAPHVEERA
jgi:hypothetical protein